MRPTDAVPAVRVLPMSDKQPGFAGLTIEQVQTRFFLGRLVRARGKWRYASSGLNADRGTAVVFQFKARAVAWATFLGDEKFETPVDGCAGVLHFDSASVRTFTPWDADRMRGVWPAFGRFGHAKLRLSPGHWPAFVKRLRDVRAAKP